MFKPQQRVIVIPEEESGKILFIYSKFEDGVWARIELDSDILVDYPIRELLADA